MTSCSEVVQTPVVDVVMVTHNSAQVLDKSLSSLANQDVDWRLIVIDNDSAPDNWSEAERLLPGGSLVKRNTDNVGFAVAANQGAGLGNAPYILLLNPDCSLGPKCLEKLLIHSEEKAIIAAPWVGTNSKRQVLPAGRWPSGWHFLVQYTGISYALGTMRHLQGFNIYERNFGDLRRPTLGVDWVSGGALLVRRDIWQRLGGLSERFFMYAEDVDFCWRAQDMGVQSAIVTDAIAEHPLGTGSAQTDVGLRLGWLRNLRVLVKSRKGRRWLISLDAALLFGALLADLSGRSSEFGRPGVAQLFRYVYRDSAECPPPREK